jgi:hypothetical protein
MLSPTQDLPVRPLDNSFTSIEMKLSCIDIQSPSLRATLPSLRKITGPSSQSSHVLGVLSLGEQTACSTRKRVKSNLYTRVQMNEMQMQVRIPLLKENAGSESSHHHRAFIQHLNDSFNVCSPKGTDVNIRCCNWAAFLFHDEPCWKSITTYYQEGFFFVSRTLNS